MRRSESIADWSPSAASLVAPVLDGDQSACSPRECLNQFTRSICPTNGDHLTAGLTQCRSIDEIKVAMDELHESSLGAIGGIAAEKFGIGEFFHVYQEDMSANRTTEQKILRKTRPRNRRQRQATTSEELGRGCLTKRGA